MPEDVVRLVKRAGPDIEVFGDACNKDYSVLVVVICAYACTRMHARACADSPFHRIRKERLHLQGPSHASMAGDCCLLRRREYLRLLFL